MADESTTGFVLPRATSISVPATGNIARVQAPVRNAVAKPVPYTAGCPPEGRWKRPQPVNRVRKPDIVGFYEQVTDPGTLQRMMLQLCSAGQAIVGWFSPPPTRGLGRPDLKSWPAPAPTTPPTSCAGAFIVDTAKKTSNGYEMHWIAGQKGAPNTTDPHETLQGAFYGGPHVTIGSFAIVDSDTVILRFDGKAQEGDRFKRYRFSARVPSAIAGNFESQVMRNLVLAEHVQPLPPTWIEEQARSLTGERIRDLLTVWYSSSGIDRRVKRIPIRNHIAGLVRIMRLLPKPHQAALMARMNVAMLRTLLTIGDETLQLAAWYRRVASDEADETLQNKLRLKDNPDLANFATLGIRPEANKGYAYVVSMAKKGKDFARGVKFGGGGFYMTVRRVDVIFKLKDGRWITDSDGVPEIANKQDLADEKKGVKFGGKLDDLLVGVFGDVGLGMGFSADSGLSKSDASPSATTTKIGGDPLGGATLYSTSKLEAESFHGASFRIVALKGPSAQIKNVTGFNLFSTIYREFHLASGEILTAVETKFAEFSPPELPKWTIIFGGIDGIKKYFEGWTGGKAEGTLVEGSMAFGYIFHTGKSEAPVPEKLPKVGAIGRSQARSTGSVLFHYDEARFQASTSSLNDGRYVLECWLAEARALFTDQDHPIQVQGYTSPEGSECYNNRLSSMRADYVRQAILDAFGAGLRNPIGDSGHGEGPALKDLENPPEDAAGLADFKKKHPDQVDRWSSWRRVDITVAQTVVVTGYSQPPPTP